MTTRGKQICALLQEIGFPAVRVKLVSAEVIESNELFSSLVNVGAPLECRLWFVECVLPYIASVDRARWEVAFAQRAQVQVQVALKSIDGRDLDFEMRSFTSLGQEKFGESILCVFIPLSNSIFERVREAHFSEGRESERRRIQNELHKGVSQQLLGAAFGCKLLAGKVETLSEDLGKEALDLAQLVNEAVVELQNVVTSAQNQSRGNQ
jgi:signal transduction histidine kinase